MTQIKVRVKTGKSDSCIVSRCEVWEVCLKSRPVDGKANLELVKLISKDLKRKVKIVKGLKSRYKILEIY